MPLDDLFKGMQLLHDGMVQYQTTQAVNDARSQLHDLQAQQTDQQQTETQRQDFQQKQMAIGQDLALRLTGAGAAPQHIDAATKGILPSASEVQQTQGLMALEHAKLGGTKEIETMKEANAFKLAKLKVAFSTGQVASKFGKEFFEQNKTDIAKLGQLEALKATIDESGGNPVGANLAQMEYVKQAVGRANWQEIQMGNPTQSIKESALRKLGIAFTNEDVSNNGKFFKKLADAESLRLRNGIEQAADGFAQAKENSIPGIDAETLGENIKLQHLSKFGYGGGASAAPKVKKSIQYSSKNNKTKVTYQDGSTEIVDGAPYGKPQ